jgi:hypothetical protein
MVPANVDDAANANTASALLMSSFLRAGRASETLPALKEIDAKNFNEIIERIGSFLLKM